MTPTNKRGDEELLGELDKPASPESKLTPEMRHQLPLPLQEMFVSDEFIDSCMDHFEQLDANDNGTLEMSELVPVRSRHTRILPCTLQINFFIIFREAHRGN